MIVEYISEQPESGQYPAVLQTSSGPEMHHKHAPRGCAILLIAVFDTYAMWIAGSVVGGMGYALGNTSTNVAIGHTVPLERRTLAMSVKTSGVPHGDDSCSNCTFGKLFGRAKSVSVRG